MWGMSGIKLLTKSGPCLLHDVFGAGANLLAHQHFSTSTLLTAFQLVPSSGTLMVPLVENKRVGRSSLPVLTVDLLEARTVAQFRATLRGLFDSAEEIHHMGERLKLTRTMPLMATDGRWALDSFHRAIPGDDDAEQCSSLTLSQGKGLSLSFRYWLDETVGVQIERQGKLAALRQVVIITPDGKVQTLGLFMTFYDSGIDWLRQYLELKPDDPLPTIVVAAAEHVYFSDQYNPRSDLGKMLIGEPEQASHALTIRSAKKQLILPKSFVPPQGMIQVSSEKNVLDPMDPTDDADTVEHAVLSVYGELSDHGPESQPYVAIRMYRPPDSEKGLMDTVDDTQELIDGARQISLMSRGALRANLTVEELD